MKQLIGLFFLVSLMTSCKGVKGGSAQNTAHGVSLLEGNWELEYIASASSLEALYSKQVPEMRIEVGKNTISGQDGCNRYSGTFQSEGNQFQVDTWSMISTKMFCEGGGGQAFTGSLGRVDSYVVTDGKLELKAGAEVVLRFHRK
ncbi:MULTISPECIES: META domain-containing protein [unclassified Flavobacterium]|uniref:META domain-containing protein n=1 Tax=unclassified Flavobacterium TaxID=196869 RepID=UPI001F13F0A3|nr:MULTISPECIES: META domain-containing protein [unclassified Flavobacterium]UMY64617.1 META domain-containing protein [Flavobacterium sp. HJ-32-4]